MSNCAMHLVNPSELLMCMPGSHVRKAIHYSFHSPEQYVTLTNCIFSMKPIMLHIQMQYKKKSNSSFNCHLLGSKCKTGQHTECPFHQGIMKLIHVHHVDKFFLFWLVCLTPKCIELLRNQLLFDVHHTQMEFLFLIKEMNHIPQLCYKVLCIDQNEQQEQSIFF